MTLRPSKSKYDLPNVYNKQGVKKLWWVCLIIFNKSKYYRSFQILIKKLRNLYNLISILKDRPESKEWNHKQNSAQKNVKGLIDKDSLDWKLNESILKIIKITKFKNPNNTCQWTQHWTCQKSRTSWSQCHNLRWRSSNWRRLWNKLSYWIWWNWKAKRLGDISKN